MNEPSNNIPTENFEDLGSAAKYKAEYIRQFVSLFFALRFPQTHRRYFTTTTILSLCTPVSGEVISETWTLVKAA